MASIYGSYLALRAKDAIYFVTFLNPHVKIFHCTGFLRETLVSNSHVFEIDHQVRKDTHEDL